VYLRILQLLRRPLGDSRPRLHHGERPIKAFISSIMSAEFLAIREETVRTLRPYPWLETWAFEYTPASSEPVEEGYLRHVREADLVIWLVADHSTVPVQREVREALQHSRPLLAFLLARDEDATTRALVNEIGNRAKWMPVEPGRLGEALQLAIDDEIVRSLRRRWAGGRLQRLEEITRASRARCIERWVAAGAPRAAAVQFADDPRVGTPSVGLPAIARGTVVLIVGEMGAGKSLLAERMLQDATRRLREEPGAPVPVFLQAQVVLGSLHDAVLSETQDLGDPRVQGAFAVIDGADEVGSGRAGDLLSEARILADTWPLTTFVITRRPVQDITAHTTVISVPPLSEEDAVALVGRVSDEPVTTAWLFGWPGSVREAMRRPLFAILLGAYLRERHDGVPRSTSDLLTSLVTRSLRRAKGSETMAERAAEQLAALATDRGGGAVPGPEVGSVDQRRALLDSGLVVEHHGALAFPLAILAQWFAARSLQRNFPRPEDLAKAPERLEDWLHPLIIAVGTLSHDETTRVLAPIAGANPAFAAIVATAGIAEWGLAEDISASPDAGQRIREAMAGWISGIGRLAALIAPIREDGSLRSIGVLRGGAWLTTGWYMGSEDVPPVLPLPPNGLTDPTLHRLWPSEHGARSGRHSAWAWRWTLEELQGALRRFIAERALPTIHPVLVREAAWAAALVLLGRGSLNHQPVPVERLEEALARLDPGQDAYSPPGQRFRIRSLRSEVTRIHSEGGGELAPPWPGPDVLPSEHRWAWDTFSDGRILERSEAVYLGALGAYVALVEEWFPRFARRLDTYAVLPAKMIGTVKPPAKRKPDDQIPVISWYFEPHSPGQPSEVKFHLDSEAQMFTAEEFQAMSRHTRAARPEVAKWLQVSWRQEVLDIFGTTPATDLTYDWLRSDLQRVHWFL
jgi:hypothetical protein